MSLASLRKRESRRLLSTYARQPLLLQRGKGVYVYDNRGRRYLDFLSGIGVNALGYGHPAIRKVLVAQSARLIHVSNLFFHDYQGELAERLARISGLDRVFFCNSGTEAFEAGLKIARAYAKFRNHNGNRPKWRVLALENSFHGRTFGSLATTGQEKYRAPFAPLMPGVEFVRHNDVEELKRRFHAGVCVIAIEIIQGEGGLQAISREFLQTARALATKNDALLLVDEIQSGLGRTGEHFAFQHYGIQPDLVTVAKPLAAGLPLGALLVRERAAACIKPGMHGTTFGGGPLACAVALEFLKTLERQSLLERVRRLGDYFRSRLVELQKRCPCIHEVRGMGLMIGIELDSGERAQGAVSQMLERGIIINRTHENVLRFLPPYIIEKRHVDDVVKHLESVLQDGKTLQANRAVAHRSHSR